MPRLHDDFVLTCVNRRRVLDVVAANPGIGFRQLVRMLPLGVGTVRHHLNILIRHGFVVEKRLGRRIALFQSDCADWRGLVALREPALQELHALVEAAPGTQQVVLVRTMAERGWKRSTTMFRLARLEQHGLVRSVCRQGRRYWPAPSSIHAPAFPVFFAEQTRTILSE